MPTIRIDPLPRIAPTARHPVTVNIRNLPANGHIETHSHTWAQLACTLRGRPFVSCPIPGSRS